MFTGNGYSCAMCGQWVAYGENHTCSPRYVFNYPSDNQLLQEILESMKDLTRILDELVDIRQLLEEINSK